MPVLEDWDLQLDVDAVLRGQGADPQALRQRSPRLVAAAERALQQARVLIQPLLLYEYFDIYEVRHTYIALERGPRLRGEALVQGMSSARQAVVMVCTIGSHLEELAMRSMPTDPVHGLALYGAGSAAVEALANAACRYVEEEAARQEWQATIPFSPGMVGWSVAEGQPQIFSLLDASQIGVQINGAAVMQPLKSLSMIMGVGPSLQPTGIVCVHCTMNEICRYRPAP